MYTAMVKYNLNGKMTNTACFSELRWVPKGTKIDITYYPDIDPDLNRKEILYYLKFINKIMPEFNFKTEKEFHFVYDTFTTKLLMYLTAARYIQEYPEIVKSFYGRYKNLAVKFEKFQECHFNYTKLPKKKYGNLGGHGLCYRYEWHREFKAITIDKFRENLTKTLNTVQGYWQ